MNEIEAQRAAIVAKLENVPNIGRVHAYERYAKDSQGLIAHYTVDIDGRTQLRGWFVQRTSTLAQSPAIGRIAETSHWKIRGYMALADADHSELVFDGLIEDIRTAFRHDENLSNTVASTVTDEAAGLQLIESGPVMFAGVLCHAATLILQTRNYR